MLKLKVGNIRLHLLIIPAAVLLGILPSFILGLPQIHYISIRLFYGFYFLIALGVIIFQIRKFGTDGLISPLTWTLIGFVYFLFLNPILNAEYFDIYSKVRLYLPLALTVFAGMVSFIAGFFLAPNIKWSWLGRWALVPVTSRLATLLVLFWGIYATLLFYISRSNGYEFYELITKNAYLFGRKEILMEKFAGLSYYLFYIVRQLPIALAALSIYCITDKNAPKWKAFLILIGLLLGIAVTINFGGRANLCYVLGAIILYLFIRNETVRKSSRTRVMFVLVIGVILFGMFFLTSLQMHFRSQKISATDLDLNLSNLIRGLENNFFHETTDQNFTLYRVVDAERSGNLKYIWGESYALAFVAMIPRRIWPNKPGGDNMYYNLAIIDPWGENVNISHSYLGELIYNFGGWGVIPGSIFFGLWAGMWWNFYLRYRTYARIQILYAMSVMPVSFMVRGTFAAMFGGILYPMLFTVVILKISKPSRRRKYRYLF